MSPRRLRFGVNVNTRAPILYPDDYSVANLVDAAVRVEELGYDGVWVGDNFFSKGRLESISTLSAIAARTRRVTLGTSALISPLRHTVWLAIGWATLDRLSGGRSILNVCVGGGGAKLGGPQFSVEFDVAGVAYNKRGEIMGEQIELLRHLWSGKAQPFAGKFHKLPEMAITPLPEQKPAPPIWISNNPHLVEGLEEKIVARMLRRVAVSADGWMTALATPDEFKSMWTRILSFAREAGRDPAAIVPSYQMTLTIERDRARAAAAAGEFLNRYYGTSYADIRQSMWGRDPMGDADECYRAIKGLIDAGCRDFAFRFAGRDQLAQIERFTADVLPRLRALR
jgi:alkanesulfonate monooxygenase